MNARIRHALGGALLLGAGLTLPRCSLLVNLDAEEVPAGPPDACALCTAIGDAGGDAAHDARGGAATDGGDEAVPEAGPTDGGADAPSVRDRGDAGEDAAHDADTHE